MLSQILKALSIIIIFILALFCFLVSMAPQEKNKTDSKPQTRVDDNKSHER